MEVEGVIKDLFKSVQEDAESLTPSLFLAIAARGDRGTRMRVKTGKHF